MPRAGDRGAAGDDRRHRFLADSPGLSAARAVGPRSDPRRARRRGPRARSRCDCSGSADYLESIEQSRQRGQKRRLGVSDPQRSWSTPSRRSTARSPTSAARSSRPARSPTTPAPRSPASATAAAAEAAKLRTTLDSFLRGRETSKYLQEQVVTDRNGRYVLMVRAEHRRAIPGIVHGGSASGASLFVEPLETVEINNDIVALEEQEAEEVRRILLALTDAFRGRPDELERTIEVATELDVIQARARFSLMVGGVEPVDRNDGTFELRGARHPLLMRRCSRTRLKIEPGRTRESRRIRSRSRFGPGPGRHPADAADPHPRHHRAEHRRQDGRAQDRGTARRDGAGGPARSRSTRARGSRSSSRCLPTSATSSRSPPA